MALKCTVSGYHVTTKEENVNAHLKAGLEGVVIPPREELLGGLEADDAGLRAKGLQW
jgi:hypothetical protein